MTNEAVESDSISAMCAFSGICQVCDGITSQAFQIKHPETSMHWRCAPCLREIIADRHGILVVGFATQTRQFARDDHANVARAIRAAQVELGKGQPRWIRR